MSKLQNNQDAASSSAPAQTYYLGPPTSFSHAAALEALPASTPLPQPSFTAILSTLQSLQPSPSSPPTYAVLPVENSTNGAVVQALDLLAQCGLLDSKASYPDVQVLDEHYLSVHHCLFVHKSSLPSDIQPPNDPATPLTDTIPLPNLLKALNIKTLYTHPQVWGQCTNFLNTHLPPGHVDKVDMSSTSAAASYISQHSNTNESGTTAAISSPLSGPANPSLVLVARNIENDPGTNTTRFLILSNSTHPTAQTSLQKLIYPATPHAPLKCLLVFTIAHSRPGSLAEALSVFARVGANLSNIQSRPSGGMWEYVFFVECLFETEGAGDVKGLVKGLEGVTEKVRLLGVWRDRLRRASQQ